jgi:hypothetical protein
MRFPFRLMVLAVLCTCSSLAASAQQNIASITFSYSHESEDGVEVGWFFEIDVAGQELGASAFTPPGGSSTPLAQGDANRRSYRDPETFPTEAALEEKYGAGVYLVEVGADSVSLTLGAPSFQSSGLTILFPNDDAEVPNDTPTFVASYDCAGCGILGAEVSDGSSFSYDLDSEDPARFQCSFPFSDFPDANPLPVGTPLQFVVGIGLLDSKAESSDGLDDFERKLVTAETDQVDFSVVAGGDLPDLSELKLAYSLTRLGEEFVGWGFKAELETDRSSSTASLYPPCTAPFNLIDEGEGDYERESGTFSQLDDLTDRFPPTNGVTEYVLIFEEGLLTTSVDFELAPPTGTLQILSPEFGEEVSRRPSIIFADHTCTTNDGMFVDMIDLATEGDQIDLPYANVTPGTFPTLLDYDEFGDNLGSAGDIFALPKGQYLAIADVSTLLPSEAVPITPSGSLEFIAEAFCTDSTEFVAVPLPGAGLLQFASLASLVALARRTRKRAQEPPAR